jgi:hypothetical protein
MGLLCGIILLLAPAAAAAATPPVHFWVEEPLTVVYEPCGLVEEGVFHRSFTTLFDKDGNETHTLSGPPSTRLLPIRRQGRPLDDGYHSPPGPGPQLMTRSNRERCSAVRGPPCPSRQRGIEALRITRACRTTARAGGAA